uniref:hypothetical protein n=1 Tax=Pararhizobium sp. IMCC3301 TaxID=3067904 RepID=UPI002740C453|nr:hypothetical protein [Pararhizobium sp. IMCC3301]
MNTSAKLGGLSPRFNAFLFASVGEDRNGTLVSVLSALARFGVDPWQEAEALADLPQADAADRLDEMILALADVPSAAANHHGIATRLIALLPQASTIQTTVRNAAGSMAPEQRSQVILWVVVMLILLLAQMMAPRPDAGASGSDTSGAMSAPLTRPGIQTP